MVQCLNSLGKEQCDGEIHYDKESKAYKCPVCGYLYDDDFYQQLAEAEIGRIDAEHAGLAIDMQIHNAKEKRALDAVE